MLREQRDRIGVQQVVTGVVRVRRRIVTETRQVDVVVRREVLEFDPPVSPGTRGDDVFDVDSPARVGRGGPGPDQELVVELREEVPVVVTETRVVERVRIGVRQVPGAAEVTTTTSREHVEISDPRS